MFIKSVVITQEFKKTQFLQNVSTVADTRWKMGRLLIAVVAGCDTVAGPNSEDNI